MKPSIQRKFTEYRADSDAGELPDDKLDDLYVRARKLYNDKSKQAESVFVINDTKTTELEEMVNQQNQIIQDLQDKLEAFMVHENKDNIRKPKRPYCSYCEKPGHTIEVCWNYEADHRDDKKEQHNQRSSLNNRRGGNRRNQVKTPYYDADSNKDSDIVVNKNTSGNQDVYCDIGDGGDNLAVTVKGSINNKKRTMLLDTGAGPNVLDMITLNSLGQHDFKAVGKDEQ